MHNPRNIDSKKIQKIILEEVKERLALDNARIVRSDALLCDTGVDGIYYGYFVESLSKYGDKTVDGGVRIYWDRFSRVHDQMSLSAPYKTVPVKKWEMSAVFVGLDKLEESWPSGGLIAQDAESLSGIVDKICSIFKESGNRFIDKYASVEGMLLYLEDAGNAAPGTWRPTLEFLLREKPFGTDDACKQLELSSMQQSTGYERHQRSWLSEHGCG